MVRSTVESGASPLSHQSLAHLGTKIHFEVGEKIIREGERTDHCLVLISGAVKVTVGAPARLLGIRGSGDLVGEMAGLLGEPRTADVFALGDVEALWISASVWREHCRQDPDLLIELIRLERTRLVESDTKYKESRLSAEQRLAKILEQVLANNAFESTPEGYKAVRLTQTELAGFLNTSRESIVNVMRGLKRSGVVHVEKGKVIVMNSELLGKVAAGDETTAP